MYLIDSNVLIEAKNRYYALDLAPGFWEWLDIAHREGLACSIHAVRDELVAGNDELSDWAREHPMFFRPIDQEATRYFGALSGWAIAQRFTPAALATFTGMNADFLLIAYAKVHGHIVVTNEQSKPESRRRVMIPDACLAMSVPTTDTFDMLRQSGARFGLCDAA